MLGKLFVRLDRVRRDPNHFRAGRLIVFPTIAHRTHLPRTHRRLIARIKKQDHYLAAMVRQTPLRAISILQGEVRRRIVDGETVAHYFISSARMLRASSTSSSVLKKCGDTRNPAPGRQSTNTFLSAKRSTMLLASSTPIITEPPRCCFSSGVLMVQPRSDAKSMSNCVRRSDSAAMFGILTASIISRPGIAEYNAGILGVPCAKRRTERA